MRRPASLNDFASSHLWKVAALGILATWLLVVGSHHEPWIDEAQAWLIARDSGFGELLFERVRYEGTPGLWHAILWTVIRCGLPYSSLFLIPACFAVAGASIVLWRSPFPAWIRAAIISSYFFAYQFGVVARSYSVDLFLVPLAACWFSGRAARPLRYAIVLGLIANLNAHGFVAAAVLGIDLLVVLYRGNRLRDRDALLGLAIAAAFGLFAMFCAWQPADNGFLREHRPALPLLIQFVEHAFVDRATIWSTAAVTRNDAVLGFVITVLALWPSLRMIGRAPGRWTFLAVLSAILAFSALAYASAWHTGFLYLFWIFAMWISWAPEQTSLAAKAGIGVISAAQLIAAVQSGVWDIRRVYSPGGEAAALVTQYRASHPHARTAAFGFKTFAMQPYWSGNQFDNYKNGALHPAWLDWRLGQAWDPFAARLGWLQLLKSRPDLIIASMSAAGGRDVPEGTCQAGYRVTHHLTGALIWRGVEVETDTLLLLERRPAGAPCR